MIFNKINKLFLVILLLFFIVRVRSEEVLGTMKEKEKGKEEEKENEAPIEDISNNNSTVPTNSTEPEKEPPIENSEEYKNVEHALKQINKKKGNDYLCLKHIYTLTLNLMYATQIDIENCDNGYSNLLDSFRETDEEYCSKYIKDKNVGKAVAYMDAHIRLLCRTRTVKSSSQISYEGVKSEKELCPVVKYLKTNYTQFEEMLFDSCKRNNNDTCIDGVLQDFKDMAYYRDEIDSSSNKIYYRFSVNETATIRVNLDKELIEKIEERCPKYATLTISQAKTLSISISAIIIYVIFMIFMSKM